MAAGAADTQMQPELAQFQAFFAARRARNNVADSREMFAECCHALLPRSIAAVTRPSPQDRQQALELPQDQPFSQDQPWRSARAG